MLIDLLPGTHQVLGQQKKTLILCDPWSVKRTPEKHWFLVMANRLSQDTGLQQGQPLRAHDKGRSAKKHIRLDLNLRECNGVPTKIKGN
jgi:hypothetical protein